VSGQKAYPLVVSLSNHSLSEQNTENETALLDGGPAQIYRSMIV
jgi:hypothetical protein